MNNYFLKIDGVAGGATEKGHEGAIEVLTFTFGNTKSGQQAAALSRGTGTVNPKSPGDLTITKKIDASGNALMLAAANGRKFSKATLKIARIERDQLRTLMSFELRNLTVSSLQLNTLENTPRESVTFSFESMTPQYFPG